jgi:hypothetical protein
MPTPNSAKRRKTSWCMGIKFTGGKSLDNVKEISLVNLKYWPLDGTIFVALT